MLATAEQLAASEHPAWYGAGIVGSIHPLDYGGYYFRSEPDQFGRSLRFPLRDNDLVAAMAPSDLEREQTGVPRRVRLMIVVN